MFIEFRLYDNNEKIVFNISRIDTIRENNKRAVVFIGGIEFKLIEDYYDVKERLNNILCNL